MLSKEKVRRKFILLRKKKYFPVEKNFFKPLIKLINRQKKKNLSLYYPSNYEVDVLQFLHGASKKKYKIVLPVIETSTLMKFKSWTINEPLYISNFGIL